MSGNTRRTVSFLALITGAVIFGMVIAGSLSLTPESKADRPAPASGRSASLVLPSFADIAEEAMPSVVSITSTDIIKAGERPPRFRRPFGDEDPFDFFFRPWPRRGPENEDRKKQAGGSGFIISEDGYILTNNHVVAEAEKIVVKLNDREQVKAKLVGKDAATDIALLKIDAKRKLRAMPLGDSDRLRVGEWVMAIGDPLNFDKTVTVGVVSAKGRSGLTADPNTRSFENFIQTDAAINFGNSGGPLLNVNGEVVGINTAIFQPAQNIGFAVPINTVKEILSQLKTKGKVTRGYLGINIRDVDRERMEAFKLPSMEGTFVESVEPGQPAEKAGIQKGDAIVKVDDFTVKDTKDLIGYVSSKAPGSKVRITLIRDGKAQTATATLAERETEAREEAEPASESGGAREKLGIRVTDLSSQLRQQLNIDPSVSGVLVEHVKEVSPAADAGLAEGDVITEINGRAVTSANQFEKELQSARKGDYIRLYVRRFYPVKVSRFVIIKVE